MACDLPERLAHGGSFLKIQVGNREPRLWLQASRDRFAGGLDLRQEGCLIRRIKKPGTGFRPGAMREFQFPE
jgi:hypothetical protein